jgi:hypothetical protein
MGNNTGNSNKLSANLPNSNNQANDNNYINNNSNSNNNLVNNNNNNVQVTSNKTKIQIPYDRWIKYDSKKWGHFKEFDYFEKQFSNNLLSPLNYLTSTNNSSSSGNNNNSNDLNLSASYYFYNHLFNNQTNLMTLNHVNGCFFKPIERLGDSQFIISQFKPNSNIIVTVPCSIARYNNKQNNDMLLRLNRVIGVCEKFLVFQIWKGNNECEIFIYEFQKSKTNCIVKKLNRRFNRRVYTCLISPSRNVVLITPDYEDNHLSSSYNTYYHSCCDELTLIINLDTLELLR